MSVDLANIICLGMNYKTANISMREYFSLNQEEEKLFFKILEKKSILSHFILLSTCNRFEIIGIDLLNVSKQEILKEVFLILTQIKRKETNFTYENILNLFYLLKGNHAIKHIFRVVSGLDSSCIGETQITGQFKRASFYAKQMNRSHILLEKVTREAIITNKKIRTQTLLKTFKSSLSYQAINVAKQIFRNLENKTFLLIGAGKMIQVVCENLTKFESNRILITNRTLKNAQAITKKIGKGLAFDLSHIDDLISKADIIISSTSSTLPIITNKDLRFIQEKRKFKPLLIIDLALPRDFSESCRHIEEVYLFDLDDLNKFTKKEEKKILQICKDSEVIIEKRLRHLKENWNFYKSNLILNHFNLYVKKLLIQEKEKTLSKNIFQNLTDEQKNNLDKMLISISKKMLSDIASSFKKAQTKDQRNHLEKSLEKLFIKNYTSKEKEVKKERVLL